MSERNPNASTDIPEKPMCSLVARSNGEDPAGSVPVWERCLVMELPAPWEQDVAESKHFPALALEALKRAERSGPPTRLQCILPDPEYSRPSHTRVMLFQRPTGPFALHTKSEYVVPHSELGQLAATLLDGPKDAGGSKRYRVDGDGTRDILVCTHGSRDACCASFGFPIYQALRDRASGLPEGVRVWRTSHTGGHRFAPTVINLPDGRYWAHLDEDVVEAVLRRTGQVERLRRHYRGWAGLFGGPLQAVEREAFLREGWPWLDYLKTGHLLDTAKGGERHTVRIAFASPDGRVKGAYEAVVERLPSVSVPQCMSLGTKGESPQYRVASLRRT
jgi:hypothetical protein